MTAADLARLDTAAGYRLSLILDPTGVRKDALLEIWIPRQPLPAAWMHLAPGDGDLLRFSSHMLSCLNTTGLFPTAPPFCVNQSTWEGCLTGVVNVALEAPRDFYLVLDEFQHIVSPDAHRAFGWVLDYLPDRLHLLVTSRQSLPLPVARLRIRRQVLEIDLR